MLLHLVDLADPVVEPEQAVRIIQDELKAFSAVLAAKPCWLVGTKLDALQDDGPPGPLRGALPGPGPGADPHLRASPARASGPWCSGSADGPGRAWGRPEPMRVGLLGGTFNPPHCGHLKLAEIALEALALDQVRFIPTALPPHKPLPAGDPDGAARLALLAEALATTGSPFRVEPMEVERGGTSFTVDTLEALAAREPGLPGSGSWAATSWPGSRPGGGRSGSWSWPPWPWPRGPDARGRRACPGSWPDGTRPRWSGAPGELVWLPGTGLDLASSDLRAGLGRGETPDGIPPQVMAAILREKRYR